MNSLPHFDSVSLKTKDLSVGYHTNCPLLSHCQLEQRNGSLIAIVGRNGIGKTTLLRTLTGTIPPLAGAINLCGQPLQNLSPKQRAKLLAFCPAQRSVDLKLRVWEFMRLARFPHLGWFRPMETHDHQAIEQALALVHLETFRERRLSTLSDGELQRTWLASALAQETPIILLDEPTAFLDFPTKNEVVALLHQLAHTTERLIFFSTHDLHTALWLPDTLWIVNQGTVSQCSPENAALSGILAQTFNSSYATFNLDSFSFRPTLLHSAHRGTYALQGHENSPAYICTQHALLRCGWTASAPNAPEPPVLQIAIHESPTSWTLRWPYQDTPQRLSSLEEVIEEISLKPEYRVGRSAARSLPFGRTPHAS